MSSHCMINDEFEIFQFNVNMLTVCFRQLNVEAQNVLSMKIGFTGKSFSEALILESVNPQYKERLFIEFPEKYKITTCRVQILF